MSAKDLVQYSRDLGLNLQFIEEDGGDCGHDNGSDDDEENSNDDDCQTPT